MFLSILPSPSWAQAPPTVDPSRVLVPTINAKTVPNADFLPTAPAAPAVPEGAEDAHFTLTQVAIEGVHALPEADLEPIYAPLLGQRVTLAQTYRIAAAITQRYRAADYLLARAFVPAQDVTDGVLRIQIVEGFISDFTVEGDADAQSAIAPYAEEITAIRPITGAALERYLLLMNDLPGLRVRSILSPAKDTPGGASMTLIAERRRIGASAGLDTFGNAFLGPTRYNARATYQGLTDGRDALSLSTLLVPDQGELFFFGGRYARILGSEGTEAALELRHVVTNPTLPAALGGALEPEGEATTMELAFQHPLLRTRAQNWYVTAQAEISRNATDYAPGFAALETEDNLRVLDLGTNFAAADGWDGYNRLAMDLRHGLEIFGSSQANDPNLSRAQGDPGFFKITAEASRLQSLWGPFSLLASTQGQLSADPLLASEEYGVGGPIYGRGFDTSEINGDHGLAAKLELIYHPEARLAESIANWQLYGFYDAGAVWSIDPLPGETARESLSASGLGMRATLFDRANGDIFFAKPLTNQITSRSDEKQDDWRVQFSLQYTY